MSKGNYVPRVLGEPFNVRLTIADHNALKALAQANERTIGAEIRVGGARLLEGERMSTATLIELTIDELTFIADNLVTLAELDEGEHTDYDELKRLAVLLRLRAEVSA